MELGTKWILSPNTCGNNNKIVCDILRYHLEDLTEETLNEILSFGTIEFVNITHPVYNPNTIHDRNAHIVMSTLQALRIKSVFPQVQVYNGKTVFQDHSPAQVQNLIDTCNKLLLGYLEGSHKIGSGSLALLSHPHPSTYPQFSSNAGKPLVGHSADDIARILERRRKERRRKAAEQLADEKSSGN